ncbi:MAG: hypothetical protein KME60_32050 [Cyanomargarita calcarea GSE-NOS-MK-12-04C]|uniref:Uncharacterized protein n=1 Tax=Cyanomargarita calcarea GSE-NOS-MK-12-04C TaxID=2839659 RepID=A0A951UWD8_9CYAN|nr:hypothetical protein [Cyanomargarita calcarea GSE-NOS-MK-12-04C]
MLSIWAVQNLIILPMPIISREISANSTGISYHLNKRDRLLSRPPIKFSGYGLFFN